MEYKVSTNEVKNAEGNLKGFASITIGDSFKLNHIAILENKEGNLFIAMPRYKTKMVDEDGNPEYKDIFYPLTKELRTELNERIVGVFKGEIKEEAKEYSQPNYTVKVGEKEVGSIKGYASVTFDDCFVVNNINVVEGKNGLFVSMPSVKTKSLDENGNPQYQEVCNPVTKEFREKLYGDILTGLEASKTCKEDMEINSAEEFINAPVRHKGKAK